MGIINRTLDTSEQLEKVQLYQTNTVTATTYLIYRCPRAMQIQSARSLCFGLSGAPTGTLKLTRFVSGAGQTTISISGALTHTAFGTSGVQSLSLPAAGSSLLNLQSGDVLEYVTATANTALTDLLVEVVLKSVADIKTWN